MSNGEIILYTTDDGKTSVQLKAEEGTVWLTRSEIAELFQTTPQNITLHIQRIYEENEADPNSTSKDYLLVQKEGNRNIQREVKLYELSIILAIGYRVRSARGTQFRRWATSHLQEYLVKGFILDDVRLKEPGSWDYFDELLERIREIRASEKRFYQKVKDIYTTAVDYDPKSGQAHFFFKKVQNKMFWALTGHTAAELICHRANPQLPNMGLTSWKGSRVRQGDITIAKNYLSQEEINELNRIVTMYLDYAEDQAKRRKTMTMNEWADKLDAFLSFNDRAILNHSGQISAQIAEQLALERYTEFNNNRKHLEKLEADKADIIELENLPLSKET